LGLNLSNPLGTPLCTAIDRSAKSRARKILEIEAKSCVAVAKAFGAFSLIPTARRSAGRTCRPTVGPLVRIAHYTEFL